MNDPIKHIVITVHGIRTYGLWQERLEELITKCDPGIKVISYKIGLVSIVTFFFPFLRWLITRRFRRELVYQHDTHQNARIDLIGHSLGTHLIAWALSKTARQKDRSDYRFHTVILAASVLKPGFNWNNVLERGTRVVNDCGTKDIVLIFNQLFVLHSGMAGRVGFSGSMSENFRNRFFIGGHSLYFEADGIHMDNYWLPLITTDSPIMRHDKRLPLHGWRRLLEGLCRKAEPIKLTIGFILPIALASVFIYLFITVSDQYRQIFNKSLSLQAINKINNDPGLACLLAAETFDAAPGIDGQKALFAAVQANPKFVTFLRGHRGRIWGLDFSPDGRLVASGSYDRDVILWDVATFWKYGVPMKGHRKEVTCVAFNPDGKFLASGSADSTIILWDIARHQASGPPLEGHRSTITDVCISPDGTILASSSADSTIILWDIATRRQLGNPLIGHNQVVRTICFSPDGKTLASGGNGGQILMWDLSTKQSKRLLSSEWCDTLPRWSRPGINSLAFSPDGTILISGGRSQSIREGIIVFWDIIKGQQMGGPYKGRHHEISDAIFSMDGKTLFIGGQDKLIALLDVSSRHPSGSPLVGHDRWVTALSCSPDGRYLASGSIDMNVGLWDLSTSSRLITGSKRFASKVECLALNPDGETLACGLVDGTVAIWNIQTDSLFSISPGDAMAPIVSIEFTTNGKILAVAYALDAIVLYDVESWSPKGPLLIMPDTRISAIAINPGGNILASLYWDGTLIIWDMVSHKPIGEPQCCPLNPLDIEFNPDGSILAQASSYDITLFSMDSLKLINQLSQSTEYMTFITISPDGKMVACGTGNGDILVWDISTLTQIGMPLKGHRSTVYCISFSPDGQILASADDDNTIILWDVKTWQAIGEPLVGHRNRIMWLEFTRDSKTLISGGADSTVYLWDVDPRSWRNKACQIANRNMSLDEWKQYMGDRPYSHTCIDQ